MPPTSKAAEKAAQERAEATAQDGYFAAQETDDNSVATSEGYIGVSPEYQNHANVGEAPLEAEDEDDEVTERVAEFLGDMARPVNPTNPALSYDPETVHPSEKVKPQDAYIEGNRALMEGAVASTQDEKPAEPSGDDQLPTS